MENEVITVRLSVVLSDLLKVMNLSSLGYTFIISRTRSNTTTVSLI